MKHFFQIVVLLTLSAGFLVSQDTNPVKSILPPELTEMFPIGREFKGVAIPSYEGERLSSVMRADTVMRVDEQFLDLTNLVISVYNAAGEPETIISMEEAAYDLFIGELRSKTEGKIDQPQFTMTGDTMIFETESQISRLVGNVVLVIPDAGTLGPAFGVPFGGSK